MDLNEVGAEVVELFETAHRKQKYQAGEYEMAIERSLERRSQSPVRYKDVNTDNRWIGFSSGYTIGLQKALNILKNRP